MKKLLVVCAGNSFRSACAAVLLERELEKHNVDAFVQSCGMIPQILEGTIGVSPYAVHLMRERGIDVTGHKPKHVSTVDLSAFDKIFTMDDELRHKLIEAGAQVDRIVILNEAGGAVPDPYPHGKDAEHADCLLVIQAALEEEIRKL